MANDTKFTPGMPVWVIDRDEDGNACGFSGYVFLAHVGGLLFCHRTSTIIILMGLLPTILSEPLRTTKPICACSLMKTAMQEKMSARRLLKWNRRADDGKK